MNLDAIQSEKELMQLWLKFSHHPIVEGRKLFPDRPKGYASATRSLAGYAANKATAISCRIGGDIRAALVYETICDSIYKKLPDYAKW